MDPAESYRQLDAPSNRRSASDKLGPAAASTLDAPPKAASNPTAAISDLRRKFQEYLNCPRTDELAIISCGLLVLAVIVGLTTGLHHDELVFAFGLLLRASCLGCISIYRIKKSAGKLWGGRLAFLGTIAFPTILVNIVEITISFRTPVGFLLVALAVAYVNYHLLLRVWNWIARSNMQKAPKVVPESSTSASVQVTV